MPETKRGRPAGNRAAEAEFAETASTGEDSTPTAECLVGRPGRTRRLFACIVIRCPYCPRGVHTHRSGARALFAGEAVRACPETAAAYRLVPVSKAVAA